MKSCLYLLICALLFPFFCHAQPWTYNLGSATGSFTTAGTVSNTTPNPASGGGRDSMRVGSGGGGFAWNTYNKAGSGSELRITAPTSTSVNKFTISNYDTTSTSSSRGYIKFDVLMEGGSSTNFGTYYFFNGSGSTYGDGSGFSGTQVFTGIRWTFGSDTTITTNYRSGGSWASLTGATFVKSRKYTTEIYFNNSNTSQTYSRSSVNYTINSNSWHLWINGNQIGTNWAKAQLAGSSVIRSFMFYAENSTSNTALMYLDNFEYSNNLPSAPANPTVSISNTGAPSAGNVFQGNTDKVLFGFQLSPSAAVNFTGANITTSGTASSSDLSNIRIVRDTDNSGTYNSGDTIVTSGLSLSNPLNFTINGQNNISSSRRYLLIADVSSTAVAGRTFSASIAAATDVISTGDESGTAAGNTQTIQLSAAEINLKIASTNYASGSIYNFGNIAWGSNSSVSFTIENTGNLNLNISGSSVNGAPFSVTSSPTSPVAPSSTTSATVSFAPTGIGTFTDTLRISNNDSDENPYLIILSGTGIANSSSDLIESGTTYTSNINYLSFRSTAGIGNSVAGTVQAMRLSLRDGGAAADADTNSTILNAVTFTVKTPSGSNAISHIQHAVLSTTTNSIFAVGTITGSTIRFPGLGNNIVAADGSSSNFILRVSFGTTITDRIKLVFAVDSVYAGSGGSQFASSNGSGAASDANNANDQNRLNVIADRLRFTTQPTGGSAGAAISTFTVSTVDAFLNLDSAGAGSVSLSTNGTGMNASGSYSISSGRLNISNVSFANAQGNVYLVANTSGLSFDNDDTSSVFTISSTPNGTYRTASAGSWSSASWERFNNGWASSSAPSNSASDLVNINHAISAGSVSPQKVIVSAGGTLTITSSSTFAGSNGYLRIDSGATLQINANLSIASGGNFEVRDQASVNVNFEYGTPASSLWNGQEIFYPNSNFVFKDWDCANDNLFTNDTLIKTNNFNGYTAAFGNLILDFGNRLSSSDDWIMLDGGVTINMCHNDLIFRTNTSSGADMRLSTSGNVVSGIGRNFIIESGYTATSNINVKTSGTLNFSIGGNFSVASGLIRIHAGSSVSSILNVNGNVSLTGGTISLGASSSASASSAIYTSGNLTVGSSGTLTSSDAGCKIVFTGTSAQTISITSAMGANVDFEVDTFATVQLINQSLNLANASNDLDVLNRGSLDFNGYQVSGIGNFSQASGGILKISSADGVNASPSALGNVINTGSRTFSTTGTFHYIGNSNPQFTGTAVSASASAKKIIIEKTNATDTLKLSQSMGITDSLIIRQGTLLETNTDSIFSSGVLSMSGGKFLSLVTQRTVPGLSGSYSISGGIVELGARGNQNLRGSRTYHEVFLSGGNTLGQDAKGITSALSINQLLSIGDSTIFDPGNKGVSGNGGLSMSGGRFRLGKTSNTFLPELEGISTPYNLSGGIIEFYNSNSSGTSQIIRTRYNNSASAIEYNHIECNANGANTAAHNIGIDGNLILRGTMNINAPVVFKLDRFDVVKGPGNFVLKTGATLKFGNDFGISNDTLTGNVRTVNKTFPSGASYSFISNQPMIAGSAFPSQVSKLYIEKTNPDSTIVLSTGLTIVDTLFMNQGILVIPSGRIELGTSTSNKGTLVYNSGLVAGSMRRWFSGTNSGNSGLFPLCANAPGYPNRNISVNYTSSSSSGGYLDATFQNNPMGMRGIPIADSLSGGFGFQIISTAQEGYWSMSPQTDSLADGLYTISATLQNLDSVYDLNQLTLLKRVGTGMWHAPGTHLGVSGTASMPTVSRSGVSGWSNFGFGGGPANPLPVKLLQFNAYEKSGQIELQWSTATEQNTSHFDVQHSASGIEFETIGTVDAAGNSASLKNYSFTDQNPLSCSGYYRLKMVDFDGYTEFSDIRAVNVCRIAEVQIYPNPAGKELLLNGLVTGSRISLINMHGATVWEGESRSAQISIATESLPSGQYILRLTETGRNQFYKISVKH